MKVEREDLSPVKKALSIEVDAQEIVKEETAVLRHYSGKVRIPGFRPGKAPLEVLRKRFGDDARQDVQERLMARSYRDAAQQEGLSPLGDPVVEEVEFEAGKPLRFKATFEVLPEFEIQNYKGLEVARPRTEVPDEDIDKFLEELRQSRRQWQSLEGQEARTGHMIVADLKGTPEDGEPFEREGQMIEIGGTDNLPAFNEKLEGAKAGDEIVFSTDYPAEYPAADLAGKTVKFEIAVKDVKVGELPDLDDEFAKDLGDFEGLAALRKDVRERLEKSRVNQADQQVKNSLLDKVLLENPILLPEVLVDQEIRHRLEEIVRRMMSQGMDPEKTEVDWKQIREEQVEGARKSVHARLALDAIAVAESLDVTDQEVEERIREDARQMGQPYQALRDHIEKGGGLQALKNQLVRERSLDLLSTVANIQNEE